jgi:uncharacterized protein (DUF488 family)
LNIWTVGHSNQSLESFLGLLKSRDIKALADVRSVPVSRYATWFNAYELRQALIAASISYVPLGAQLGGRPDGAALYNPDGRVSYVRMAGSAPVRAGIERLARGARGGLRIAIMCSEEDPAGCHRLLLLTPLLAAQDLAVLHLRADGRVQTGAQIEQEVAGRPHAERERLEAARAGGFSVRPIRRVLPRK